MAGIGGGRVEFKNCHHWKVNKMFTQRLIGNLKIQLYYLDFKFLNFFGNVITNLVIKMGVFIHTITYA